jgi:hypothetical protein
MPTSRFFLTAAAAHDGRIYAIGGWDGSSALGVVEAYDPSTNTWASVPALPTPRYGLAAAVGKDGRIYTVGGRTTSGTLLRTVEIYNP